MALHSSHGLEEGLGPRWRCGWCFHLVKGDRPRLCSLVLLPQGGSSSETYPWWNEQVGMFVFQVWVVDLVVHVRGLCWGFSPLPEPSGVCVPSSTPEAGGYWDCHASPAGRISCTVRGRRRSWRMLFVRISGMEKSSLLSFKSMNVKGLRPGQPYLC